MSVNDFLDFFEHFSGWLDSLYLVDICGVEAVCVLRKCASFNTNCGFSRVPGMSQFVGTSWE
jgi:hypothetical protein